MTEINLKTKTLEKIYQSYKNDTPRQHLGASEVGEKCLRKIWYKWRWVKIEKFDGRMLRLFKRGHREEPIFIEDLEKIGIKVFDAQQSFSNFGHFGGSIDGKGFGFIESSKDHLLEFKTSNTKGFKKLVKEGVKLSKPEHYAQVQVYMAWTGLDRCFYFCVCKETDEIHAERINFDQSYSDHLFQKAKNIIESSEPPERISESKTSFGCKFCIFKNICFEESTEGLEVNCRTCLHSTPLKTGKCRWKCELKSGRKIRLNYNDQQKACEDHLFIPGLVNEKVTGANKEENFVKYETFTNGKNFTTSKEIILKDLT